MPTARSATPSCHRRHSHGRNPTSATISGCDIYPPVPRMKMSFFAPDDVHTVRRLGRASIQTRAPRRIRRRKIQFCARPIKSAERRPHSRRRSRIIFALFVFRTILRLSAVIFSSSYSFPPGIADKEENKLRQSNNSADNLCRVIKKNQTVF